MSTTAVQQRLVELWESPKTLHGFLGTVDHKELGRRYIFTAFVFLIAGGIEALMMRLQLWGPQGKLLTPEMYDQIFTMHGVTMIWWYASPILSGFSIFVVPLMIGARDLAYPRLNAFTYWSFVFSGILLYIAPLMGQAPNDGWFAYVPYSTRAFSAARGMDFYNMALILLTISTTGNAVNFVTTILRMRCPGMTISKMPLMMFSTLTQNVIVLIAMPALTACNILLELDRRWYTKFFDVMHGGNALLWQHMFWFFGHPWVYIVFLPATGMMSMLIPVFARRPIVGYQFIAASTVLTGLTGFGVWVHHMFTTGIGHLGMSFFSAASMTISVYTIIQVFCWLSTVWNGKPVMTASMHFAMGFIALIVVGGLSGVATAVIPLDWQINDTYWVVSHIHYVLVGANFFPVMAAFYYWAPKMTGRMLSERWGKISFWTMFIGFQLAFFTMHVLGIEGMPRRIYTYVDGLGWGYLNKIITVGAFILAVGILMTFINFFWSLKHGVVAGKNPWNADTLEWATDSPPAAYEVVHIPTVVSRHPLWDDHDEDYDPTGERILDEGRLSYTTTPLDAKPVAIARIAKDTIKPMLVALGAFVVCGAWVFSYWYVAYPAALFTLIIIGLWLRPNAETEEA